MAVAFKVSKKGTRFRPKPKPESASILQDNHKVDAPPQLPKIQIPSTRKRSVDDTENDEDITGISDAEVSFILNIFPDGCTIKIPSEETESRILEALKPTLCLDPNPDLNRLFKDLNLLNINQNISGIRKKKLRKIYEDVNVLDNQIQLMKIDKVEEKSNSRLGIRYNLKQEPVGDHHGQVAEKWRSNSVPNTQKEIDRNVFHVFDRFSKIKMLGARIQPNCKKNNINEYKKATNFPTQQVHCLLNDHNDNILKDEKGYCVESDNVQPKPKNMVKSTGGQTNGVLVNGEIQQIVGSVSGLSINEVAKPFNDGSGTHNMSSFYHHQQQNPLSHLNSNIQKFEILQQQEEAQNQRKMMMMEMGQVTLTEDASIMANKMVQQSKTIVTEGQIGNFTGMGYGMKPIQTNAMMDPSKFMSGMNQCIPLQESTSQSLYLPPQQLGPPSMPHHQPSLHQTIMDCFMD